MSGSTASLNRSDRNGTSERRDEAAVRETREARCSQVADALCQGEVIAALLAGVGRRQRARLIAPAAMYAVPRDLTEGRHLPRSYPARWAEHEDDVMISALGRGATASRCAAQPATRRGQAALDLLLLAGDAAEVHERRAPTPGSPLPSPLQRAARAHLRSFGFDLAADFALRACPRPPGDAPAAQTLGQALELEVARRLLPLEGGRDRWRVTSVLQGLLSALEDPGPVQRQELTRVRRGSDPTGRHDHATVTRSWSEPQGSSTWQAPGGLTGSAVWCALPPGERGERTLRVSAVYVPGGETDLKIELLEPGAPRAGKRGGSQGGEP